MVVPVFEPEGEELPGPEQAEPAEPAAGRGTSHSNRAEAKEILAQAKEPKLGYTQKLQEGGAHVVFCLSMLCLGDTPNHLRALS